MRRPWLIGGPSQREASGLRATLAPVLLDAGMGRTTANARPSDFCSARAAHRVVDTVVACKAGRALQKRARMDKWLGPFTVGGWVVLLAFLVFL